MINGSAFFTYYERLYIIRFAWYKFPFIIKMTRPKNSARATDTNPDTQTHAHCSRRANDMIWLCGFRNICIWIDKHCIARFDLFWRTMCSVTPKGFWIHRRRKKVWVITSLNDDCERLNWIGSSFFACPLFGAHIEFVAFTWNLRREPV